MGYDLNLTYPQNGHFPSVKAPLSNIFAKSTIFTKQALFAEAMTRYATLSTEAPPDLQKRSEDWLKEKRDLSGKANGTIDTLFQCSIYEEMIVYALNYSFPWSKLGGESESRSPLRKAH